MLSDMICGMFLICSMCSVMVYSLNRAGYDFQRLDAFKMCVIGVLVFIVPAIIINTIF